MSPYLATTSAHCSSNPTISSGRSPKLISFSIWCFRTFPVVSAFDRSASENSLVKAYVPTMMLAPTANRTMAIVRRTIFALMPNRMVTVPPDDVSSFLPIEFPDHFSGKQDSGFHLDPQVFRAGQTDDRNSFRGWRHRNRRRAFPFGENASRHPAGGQALLPFRDGH